ncbi:MAG: sulfatase-like hydrolase/transferase [Bryobacteraceae bacterium]|nr:sulfatase-like hydrolase/transferase [Bryobacteraceae bacterium]
MLTRRTFVAAAAAAPVAAQTRRQPNFIFILADDHAGYVLGCDGNKKAHTPNIDRLASEGTRFAANYCNAPVCTPSRQSFLTGQLPHAAGVTVLTTPLDPGKPTIAKQLKSAGYTTAVFGKMHFNRPAAPGLHGFDHMLTEGELTRAWQKAGGTELPSGTVTKTLPWRPFQTPASEWLNAGNLPYPRLEKDMRSAYLLRRATEYLTENKDRQFALWVSFQEPHSPFDFPVGNRKFTAADFEAPRVGPEDAWQIPRIFRDLSEEQKRGIIAAYYNSAEYLDRNVGGLLDQLKKLNLDENTVIVYMADHGYSLGQHGRFEKHCGYDPALRVPLVMRWPGHIRQGVVTEFTESVDVPPTILDLLGAPPLPVQHGHTLRPWLEGKRPGTVRDHIFSQYSENEEAFLRTKTHKLIYCSGRRKRTDGYLIDNPTPGAYTRLYNLQADPEEFTDVSAQTPKVVSHLKTLMIDRFRKTHPDAVNEPPRANPDDLLNFYVRPRDAPAEAGA